MGPWDGFFTFAMEERGADVVAIDYVDLDSFRAIHGALSSRAEYLQLDVYELDSREHGMFDYVLLLGVLYHLKHPLLALERVCAVTREICIVDTFVSNAEEWCQGTDRPLPWVEFYEHDELGGQLDKWSRPSVRAVQALVRAAGFAQADVLKVSSNTARVSASSKWRNLPPDEGDPLEVIGISAHIGTGRTFSSKKEAYLGLWCAWAKSDAPALDQVYPEIDGYGIAPLHCAITPDGLLVNVRLPPGLLPGQHRVSLKIGASGWSDSHTFHVDPYPIDNLLKIVAVQDGRAWAADVVNWELGGWLTIWLDGLSQYADSGNTVVLIGSVPHLPHAVIPANGQINVSLRPIVGPGLYDVVVEHRAAKSATFPVSVVGPPPISGLEKLGGRVFKAAQTASKCEGSAHREA